MVGVAPFVPFDHEQGEERFSTRDRESLRLLDCPHRESLRSYTEREPQQPPSCPHPS